MTRFFFQAGVLFLTAGLATSARAQSPCNQSSDGPRAQCCHSYCYGTKPYSWCFNACMRRPILQELRGQLPERPAVGLQPVACPSERTPLQALSTLIPASRAEAVPVRDEKPSQE
jgi:hypothetical protein